MWQKTKALTWKKTSTNYSKWEYFTSSSSSASEANQPPILPKNDPNFKALELDLEQRSRKRADDRKKADELKRRGNELLEEGKREGGEEGRKKIVKATEVYGEAINCSRDYMVVYTNRALAYIKIGMLLVFL